MISCVDLFCGVGGLTHGLAKAGIDVTAGYDIDDECSFAYEKNNNAVFVKKDVAKIHGSELQDHWSSDQWSLLAGCAPCQPFSSYSRATRKNKVDDQWELVRHFSRLVDEARPDLVTMENVSQLERHPVFDDFLKALEGYSVWKSIIDCSDIGVPQTRKRLVLLASRLGPIELNVSGRKLNNTVARAISNLPPVLAGKFDPNDRMHHACNLSAKNLERIQVSRPGGSWREWPVSLRAKCHKESTGKTYPSVYGRMEWGAPAPTITTQCFGYGNGRFGHPEQDRAITLREAAMLQTFPKNYKFLPKGKKPVFHTMGRLIGNAVPVRLGFIIGNSLVSHANNYS